jgi:hypothetical protein
MGNGNAECGFMRLFNRGVEIELESFINPQSAISTPFLPFCLSCPFGVPSLQAIFGQTKIRVTYFGRSNLKRNFEAGL